VWEHPVVDPVDPEERVAELERQLREVRAAAWRVESSGATGVSSPNSPARDSYSPFGPDGTALATAPRRVPIGFMLAEFLPFRWWYLFAMFMVAIPPIIVWIMQPALFLPAAVIVLLAAHHDRLGGRRRDPLPRLRDLPHVATDGGLQQHGADGPSTMTSAPGTALIVNGANESRSIVCDMNDVTINGSGNRVDINGHCRSVIVFGSDNHVSVDTSDAITANGIENLVTFRAGAPQISSGGISNVVRPG
jgi:Protein of unknown function (DUF3060)